MNQRISINKIIYFFLASILFLCCKKDKPEKQPATPIESLVPSISSVSPVQGKQGDTIVITGKNFSDIISKNKLTMRGVEANIIEATSTMLKAIIPDMTTNGPIKVSVNGNEATGPDFIFLILPAITSVMPTTGQQGDTITITGTHFGADISANKVIMNGVEAKIVEANANTVKVLVPNMQTPGEILVKTSVGLSNAISFSFFIPPAPVINSISPLTITQGDTITIHGANFNPTIAGNTFTVNGSKVNIVKATATSLQYVFEEPSLHGNVAINFQLTTNGGTVMKSNSLKIYDVYIVGAGVSSSGASVPGYWKNGQPIRLPGEDMYSSSIAVANGNVYVGGYSRSYYLYNDHKYSRRIPLYWKNGSPNILLEDTTTMIEMSKNDGYVQGIAVENSNVHVVYFATNLGSGKGWDWGVYYWKNGTATRISSDNGVTGIWTFDNDVYILGFYGYWKNNVYYQHPTDNGFSGMYASNNNVYISSVKKVAPFRYIVKYYKNGVATELTDGSSDATSRCIYVSGNDVYVGGYDGDPAVYWKNGVKYKMTNGFGAINDIKKIDGWLYMCGSEGGSAKYWKNGVEKTLPPFAGAGQTGALGILLY